MDGRLISIERLLRAGCAIFAAGLALGSCKNSALPVACTEIGCSSYLAVHLEAMPVGAFTVELLVNGASAAPNYVYTCSGATACLQTVYFDGYTQSSAQVRITTSKGSVTTSLTGIAYIVSNPNGDECPPVCKQATVNLPLPS